MTALPPCESPNGHLADHACPCGHYWMIHRITGECPSCALTDLIATLQARSAKRERCAHHDT